MAHMIFGAHELKTLIQKVRKNHAIELRLVRNPMVFINHLLEMEKRVDAGLIKKAYYFALKQHAGQMRASGEPYFVHLYGTANTLAELGADSEIVAAGLLHDVIEDTYVDEDSLRADFGDTVYNMVKGVSKLKYLSIKSELKGKDAYSYYLKTLMNASIQDIRILIIKLADKLHNASTLEHLSEEQQQRISMQILDVYVPLAQIIGLHPIADQLAGYSFPYAYPKEYKIVKKFADSKRKKQNLLIQSIIKEIEPESKKYKIKISFANEPKPYYSIYRELYKLGRSKDELYDFVSLNILTENNSDCYVTLGLMHSLYNPIPQMMRDYIATPQLIYSGLHTTIVCKGSLLRVRIRTKAMDDVTKYGLIKILKEKKAIINNLKKKWSDLKSFNLMKDDKSFVDALKLDFLELHVYVFTEKGEIIRLPVHSSVIDFAYKLKPKKASRMCCAKVNGKDAPFWQSLDTGDVVKVRFKKNVTAHEEWLNYVKSPRVKELIMKDLKLKPTSHTDITYPVIVIVDCADRKGLLADLTKRIADKDISIKNVTMFDPRGENNVRAEFLVDVRNKKEVDDLIVDLGKVKSVITAKTSVD